MAKTTLIFRKNLVKVLTHLVIHSSFINLWERRKNTNWTIVLNIWLVFLFMCWQNICSFQVWEKIRTEHRIIETGVEITLGHSAWPNIFATWSVIDFPNFKLCPVIMWTKNWKLFTFFLDFKVFINKVEITNPKDVYLPRNITNYNLCALLSTCNPSQMTWWKLGQQNNSPILDWLLKTFDAHDLGIQKIRCLST